MVPSDAELDQVCAPRPHIKVPNHRPTGCGWSKRTLTAVECRSSWMSSITPVTSKPVNALATPADKLLVYFCCFHVPEIYLFITPFFFRYPFVTPAAALVQRFGYRAEKFAVRVAVVILIINLSLKPQNGIFTNFSSPGVWVMLTPFLLSDCMMSYFLWL